MYSFLKIKNIDLIVFYDLKVWWIYENQGVTFVMVLPKDGFALALISNWVPFTTILVDGRVVMSKGVWRWFWMYLQCKNYWTNWTSFWYKNNKLKTKNSNKVELQFWYLCWKALTKYIFITIIVLHIDIPLKL